MYRTNHNRGMSPRDRIDPRLVERYANCNETVHAQNSCGGCAECQNRSENDACESYTAEFDYALAMVYSPVQGWQNVYCVEEGFMTGTIFRELDKPFYGPRCHGGNCQ